MLNWPKLCLHLDRMNCMDRMIVDRESHLSTSLSSTHFSGNNFNVIF